MNQKMLVNILGFLMIFALADHIANLIVSTATCLAILFILFDMLKKKSVQGLMLQNDIYKPIIVFWGTILFSSIVIWNIGSVKIVGDYIYWALPFFIMIYLGSLCDLRKSVVNAIGLSLVVTGCYALYQYFFVFPAGARIGAFHYNPNFYAVMLTMILPFIMFYCLENYKNNQMIILGIIAILLGLISLWLTGSRGALLGFVAGLLIVVVIKCILEKQFKPIVIMTIFILGASAILINFGMKGGLYRSYDFERIYLLQSSYNMWNDHKLFGVGLDNWKDEYHNNYILPQAKERNLIIPHNIVAWFFSSCGSIGGIGYLVFMFGVFAFIIKSIIKEPHNYFLWSMLWAFSSISIHGLVDVGITMKISCRLLFALLGLSVASTTWNWKKKIE